MNVGIIGTGDVGRALASGLTAAGHDVVLGSRNPDRALGDYPIRSQRAAAKHAEAVVLAVPPAAAIEVAGDLEDELAGTTVLDAANEYPTTTSHDPLAVRVAAAAPAASVVKAFNTIGANRMTDPVIDGDRATMFVAGDDDAAVGTAAGLARDLGFDPVRAGELRAARHLENLARFWIDLGREYGRDVGFRLLGGER